MEQLVLRDNFFPSLRANAKFILRALCPLFSTLEEARLGLAQKRAKRRSQHCAGLATEQVATSHS
jgi:hypothetical protein